MKQLFQDLRDGSLRMEEVPCPTPGPGQVQIQAVCSLISAGTERMLLDFGRSSWLQKIRSQPDKVRQVRQKIKSDGLVPTLQAVRRKLASPIPLGYSHVGRVLGVGPGVAGLASGDLVLSNGHHAEVVTVPRNLCVKVPASVAPEEACFGIVGAIALQGIRLAAPTLGERVAVIGLGLIGQLSVQLLKAQGCQVLAIDLDPEKVALAERWGALGCVAGPGSDPVAAGLAFTQARGMDAVLITAATSSNLPLLQAAEMSRQRGRIILVGVVSVDAPRDLFYKKELSFQVSCSYGPGRYDHEYEEKGRDYPFAFVRWTEQRNFEAILDQMAEGRIQCGPLISGRFAFSEAEQAYAMLLGDRNALGLLLTYPGEVITGPLIQVPIAPGLRPVSSTCPGIALIGAGQYTLSTLLPALDQAPAHRRVAIASRQGASATLAARAHGFAQATTDPELILRDTSVDAVVITTRHDSHAELVVRSLEAGKHVFVEKPLATTLPDLERVRAAMLAHPELSVTVGYNRPWAPMTRRLREALDSRRGPALITCEINAGELPLDHWLLGPQGGGRLIGEGCHFIDLMRFMVGAPILSSRVQWARRPDGSRSDSFSLLLDFQDGSVGSLLYSAVGSKAYPKETYTLHWDGKIAKLTNFQRLEGWGVPLKARAWSQDKGHADLLGAWIRSLGKESLQHPGVLLEVSEAILRAGEDPS